MSDLLLHLRVTRLWLLSVPLAAVAVVAVLLRDDFWVGIWPETGATGQFSAFYLSVIGAGVAAWRSSATDRLRLGEQYAASVRSRWSIELNQLSALLVVFLVPYVIGQMVAFTFTARTFPPGVSMWIGYFVMGLILIVFAVVMGWGFGRYLPPKYGSIMAAIVWLNFQLWTSGASGLWVVSGPTWETPRLPMLIIRGVAAILCVALIAWHPSVRRFGLSSKALRFAPGIAAAALAITAISSTDAIALRDAAETPRCVDGEIHICLWPEDEKYVPMIEEFNARLKTLPTSLVLPEEVKQYGLIQETVTYQGTEINTISGLDISEGNRWALASGLANLILATTRADCDLDSIFADPVANTELETISRWIELHLANDGPEPDYRTEGVPDEIAQGWRNATDLYTTKTAEQQTDRINSLVNDFRSRHCP